MNFETYLRNGWIKPHQTSADEITRLLAVADRDIAQAQAPSLQPEWRFDIAYNAALQLATAALAASGYQAERQNKHQRTIECMAFSLLAGRQDDVDFFNTCRQKRNTSVYELVGAISSQEAQEMAAFAKEMRQLIRRWLKQHHANLLK